MKLASRCLEYTESFSDLGDDEKSILLTWTLSAHVNRTRYSPEEDPSLPKKPAECFGPLRVRGLGDCEDAAWYVDRYRSFLPHPKSNFDSFKINKGDCDKLQGSHQSRL